VRRCFEFLSFLLSPRPPPAQCMLWRFTPAAAQNVSPSCLLVPSVVFYHLPSSSARHASGVKPF
jgi:hypothetical protein